MIQDNDQADRPDEDVTPSSSTAARGPTSLQRGSAPAQVSTALPQPAQAAHDLHFGLAEIPTIADSVLEPLPRAEDQVETLPTNPPMWATTDYVEGDGHRASVGRSESSQHSRRSSPMRRRKGAFLRVCSGRVKERHELTGGCWSCVSKAERALTSISKQPDCHSTGALEHRDLELVLV